MDSVSDEQFIAAHLRGDQAALRQLIDRHLPAVSAYCFQLVLRRSLAEDLVQETFLRAIRSLAGYRGTASFQTWLFTIASNLAKTRLNRVARELPAGEEVDDMPTRSDCAPDRPVLAAELAGEIDVAINDLPLHLRSTLVLFVVHEMSPQEIADVEGCSLNTVYWRIHEARKALKRRLEPWTT